MGTKNNDSTDTNLGSSNFAKSLSKTKNLLSIRTKTTEQII